MIPRDGLAQTVESQPRKVQGTVLVDSGAIGGTRQVWPYTPPTRRYTAVCERRAGARTIQTAVALGYKILLYTQRHLFSRLINFIGVQSVVKRACVGDGMIN